MTQKPYPSIDYIIRTTWLCISKMYNEFANEYSGTMVHGFTLLSINPVDGTPSTSLGPKMGLEPTSLSRALKSLEQEGFIERHPNPEDGRGIIIKLTESGKAKRELSKSFVLSFHNEISKAVTKEQLDNFFHVLETIQKIANSKRDNMQPEKLKNLKYANAESF